jgi:TonB family protein
MTKETVRLTAVGSLLRFGSLEPLPDGFSSAVIDAVSRHIAVPSPLALSVYAVKSSSPGVLTRPQSFFPSFSSEFLVVFRLNGSIKKLTLIQRSLAPEVDAAVAKAIYAADSANSFPPISEATRDSELTVFIEFGLTDFPAQRSYPIFIATVPLYSPAYDAIPSKSAIRISTSGSRQPMEGKVVLEFVVDEGGKIVQGAYRFAEISDEDFGRAVLAAIPTLRFQPARIGDCLVKQFVRQAFEFKLR